MQHLFAAGKTNLTPEPATLLLLTLATLILRKKRQTKSL
jgi:hypothetical protein